MPDCEHPPEAARVDEFRNAAPYPYNAGVRRTICVECGTVLLEEELKPHA